MDIQRHVNIHLRDMDIIIISQLSDLSQPANCSVPVAVEYNTNNKLSRLTFWSIRELQVSAVIDPFIYGSERILGMESPTWKCYVITFPALRSNVAKNVLLDND